MNWASHVPFSLEQRLRSKGAQVQASEARRIHVVRDGILISGQNPASAAATARLVLEALRHG